MKERLFILQKLFELQANIQPIETQKFTDTYLKPKFTDKEIATAWSILTTDKLIDTYCGDSKNFIFYTALIDQGVKEIDKLKSELLLHENIKLTNKKLKNEWWKIPIGFIIGAIFGVILPILKKWLSIKLGIE